MMESKEPIGLVKWRDEWERNLAHFHNAFTDTPDDEVERDIDNVLARARVIQRKR